VKRSALTARLRLEGSFQLERPHRFRAQLVFRELDALSYARVPATTALR
jgi:hypothetical protein